jgi:hypothetical protein
VSEVASGRWVRRPWWVRLSAASAVPPPFAVPILCGLAVLAASRPEVAFRPAYAAFAAATGMVWLLSATAWVRVGAEGLLYRHLWRVHGVPWETVTGCATIWAEQGRKQVRVVAVEIGPETMVLLWPSAWIGEPNRRALVEAVKVWRNQRVPERVPARS